MRYITSHILNDLKRKMVFVGGPRQVGKTTLAKAVLSSNYPDGRYLNWDFDEDSQGYKYELRYIRDKEGREVDFAIVKEGELEELIEVKYSDDSIARSLSYYADRLNPKKAVQIVSEIKRPYDKGKS